MKYSWLVVGLSGVLILFMFQNCGEVRFTDAQNGRVTQESLTQSPDNTSSNLEVSDVPNGMSPPDSSSESTTGSSSEGAAGSSSETSTNQSEDGDGDIDYPAYGCSGEALKDLIVNIERVEMNGQTLAAGLGQKSLLDGFDLPAGVNASGSELRLVLAPEGNHVIDQAGVTYSLKTPSGQESGLKVKLGGMMNVTELTMYHLELAVDPSSMVVRNKSKCLLKPVFTATEFTAK